MNSDFCECIFMVGTKAFKNVMYFDVKCFMFVLKVKCVKKNVKRHDFLEVALFFTEFTKGVLGVPSKYNTINVVELPLRRLFVRSNFTTIIKVVKFS